MGENYWDCSLFKGLFREHPVYMFLGRPPADLCPGVDNRGQLRN